MPEKIIQDPSKLGMTKKDISKLLREILNDMNIRPEFMDLEKPGNLVWLNRHLAMNHLTHPQNHEARNLLQSLMIERFRRK